MYTNKQYNVPVEQMSQQTNKNKEQQFQLKDSRESTTVQKKLIEKIQRKQKKMSQQSPVTQTSRKGQIATSELHIPIQRQIFYNSEVPGNEAKLKEAKDFLAKMDTSFFQTENTHLYVCLYAADDGNNGTTELRAGTPPNNLTDLSDNLPSNANLTIEIRINLMKVQGDLIATVFHEFIAHSIKENLMHISAIRKGIPYSSPEDIEDIEHFIYGTYGENYLQNLKQTESKKIMRKIMRDIARYRDPLNKPTFARQTALNIIHKLLEHPLVAVFKQLDQTETCPLPKNMLDILMINQKLINGSYTSFLQFWDDLEASFQQWEKYFSDNNALSQIPLVQTLRKQAHNYKDNICYNT